MEACVDASPNRIGWQRSGVRGRVLKFSGPWGVGRVFAWHFQCSSCCGLVLAFWVRTSGKEELHWKV